LFTDEELKELGYLVVREILTTEKDVDRLDSRMSKRYETLMKKDEVLTSILEKLRSMGYDK
jgi:hypothetical protein